MNKQIAGAAATVVGLTVLSKIAGYLRESTIAYKFGAGSDTDAYFAAFSLITIIVTIIRSVIETTYIPGYNRCQSSKERSDFFSSVINTCFLLGGGLVLLGEVFSIKLIEIVASGFSSSKAQLTSEIIRIMLPSVILMSVNSVLIGTLQSHNRFFVSTLIGLPFNLSIIALALLLGTVLGIKGLAIGVTVGYFTQTVLLVIGLHSLPVSYSLARINFRNSNFRYVFKLVPAVLLGNLFIQAYQIVDVNIGSLLGQGVISYLKYAERVNILATALFGDAIISVFYPQLARAIGADDAQSFTNLTVAGVRLLSFILFPITITYMISSKEIISIIFQRGAFGASETMATANVLKYYALGILPFALNQLLIRVFYARQEVKYPIMVSAISLCIYVLVLIILKDSLTLLAVPIAFCTANVIRAMLFLLRIQRDNPTIWSGILPSIRYNALAVAFVALVVFLMQDAVNLLPGNLIRLCSSGAIVFMAYVVAHWRLKTPEYSEAMEFIKLNLKRVVRLTKTRISSIRSGA